MLVIPGEGERNLQLSSGAVVYPLTTAPSGCLLLRCDGFEQPQRLNLRPRTLAFNTSPEGIAAQRRILEAAASSQPLPPVDSEPSSLSLKTYISPGAPVSTGLYSPSPCFEIPHQIHLIFMWTRTPYHQTLNRINPNPNLRPLNPVNPKPKTSNPKA